MAPEDWPNLKAARNRANSLIRKFNLTPPVDVKTLLLERAQVEYVDWPHQCDAVTVLSEDPPRVFVRDGLPPLRERFTLAHELAHISLAWHIGTVNCQVDPALIDSELPVTPAAGTQEREANEFASRLLAPDHWLRPLVKGLSSFERSVMQLTLDNLTRAEMSAQAGLIALSRHLLPGHAFIIDQNFATSRGTMRPGNSPLSDAEIAQYLEQSVAVEEFSHQGRTVLWALTDDSSFPSGRYQWQSDDTRTPHQVLISCCSRVFGEDSAQAKAWSINGVVGGMTNTSEMDWHEEAIISVVRQRISNTAELREILSDPEFLLYLQKRARAIVLKRANPSK
ncbi:ImmA/IrrE family metallo-endopeptidase [Streptomyces goshikiensis]|uniref:ImmA/IrrE family metallo-endopeptidase n=1 Tax=Streptomyces goshikiensis TaxID=1942 RepID=UPI0037189863